MVELVRWLFRYPRLSQFKGGDAVNKLRGRPQLRMCGRFALGNNHAEIFANLIRDGILPAEEDPEWVDEGDFYPRYNVAPQSRAAVVRQRATAGPGDSEDPTPGEGETTEANQGNDASYSSPPVSKNVVQTMKWGVLPRNKTQEDPKTLTTINAKIETILEGSLLWSPLANAKRCVVVCDGYYEWQTKGKRKLPYFIRHADPTKKLYFAGLWDVGKTSAEDNSPVYTFSIVTVPARPDMEWLHERMPLIFSPTSSGDMENLSFWLDTKNTWTSGIKNFLASYKSQSEPFTIYRVPPEVGKVGQESPSFIQPIDERKDGIKASFARQSAGTAGPSSPAKRQRSSTPDSSAKRAKSDSSELAGPSISSSPKKPKPPASPKKQSPSKKSKAQGTASIGITHFFPITSPRKAGQ